MPDKYSPKIVSSALSDPFRVIEERGGDVCKLSGLAGIQPDIGNDMIGLSAFVHLIDLAADELNFPEFGWVAGANFDLRNIGDLGQFILEAPTLRAALSLFRRAFAIVQSDSELLLTVNDDVAVLSYSILDLNIWPRRQDAELTLSLLHSMVKSVAGENWRPTRITMEHDTSAIWKNARYGPRCPVEYNAQSNSLTFPARLLDLPMNKEATSHFKTLASALSNEATNLQREAPVTIRVRREVIRRFGRESLDQTEIAGALGYSRRTLRRRLVAENRSFSSILSDCRTHYAERVLQFSDQPLNVIANHLGYSEISAFERAFKLARGVTPAQYRKRFSI